MVKSVLLLIVLTLVIGCSPSPSVMIDNLIADTDGKPTSQQISSLINVIEDKIEPGEGPIDSGEYYRDEIGSLYRLAVDLGYSDIALQSWFEMHPVNFPIDVSLIETEVANQPS